MPWDDLNAINESESSWFKQVGGCSPTTSSLPASMPPAAREESQSTDNLAPSPAARPEESTSPSSAGAASGIQSRGTTSLDREDDVMNSAHPETGMAAASEPRDISQDRNMDVDPSENSLEKRDLPMGIEDQMDVDNGTQGRVLRPRPQGQKGDNNLGKRKEAPPVYVRSAKKSKGSKAHRQPQSIESKLGSSLEKPIDVDKLFVSIKVHPAFHLFTFNHKPR
jgi:hypothetical protein